MSEPRKEKRRVVGITPWMQTILIGQSTVVARSFNRMDLLAQYATLKVFIGLLPPDVKEQVIEEWNQFETDLAKIEQVDGADQYTRGRKRQRLRRQLYNTTLLPLFDRIMDILYKGPYLQRYGREREVNVTQEQMLQLLTGDAGE